MPVERRECDEGVNATCPVSNRWQEWQPWTVCSQTCGPLPGKQFSLRYCDTMPCQGLQGPRLISRHCNLGKIECVVLNDGLMAFLDDIPCPVSNQWEAWHTWSPCSRTCGGGLGFRSRSRYCTLQPDCADLEGDARETTKCFEEAECQPSNVDFY